MMIEMIEFIVCFIGPDVAVLYDDLIYLGARHKAYGLKPRNLFSLEHSLFYAMEELLEDTFTREERRAWEEVFQMIIEAMYDGMK